MLNDVYTGVSISIEIMRGCLPMREKKYVKECGVNSSILVSLTENATTDKECVNKPANLEKTTPLKTMTYQHLEQAIVTGTPAPRT